MPELKLPRLRRQPTRPPEKPVDAPSLEEPDQEDGHGARMGFFEHLDELRMRLVRASIALVIGVGIGLAFATPGLEFLRTPYCQVVALNDAYNNSGGQEFNPDTVVIDLNNCRFQTLGPTGGVVAYFRVALLLGGIIAVPMITYQLLMFIFPGLTRRERRVVLLSLPAVMVLFLIGVAFSWFILMPPALGFLEGFQQNLFRPEWTADLYLSFVTSLIFWMGVAFETPLIFFVLGLLGLVSTRPLIRNWRVAVVGAAIAAALITPTIDPVNMGLVMGPLLVLYVLSVFLVFVARRISRIDETSPY
ncbi:MAG: twin-arginine translocase subunit TatC [Anaerolineae bacterium]|nr:twin-arginine translocase subunit TatC [Anaerolineae bacterium]